MTDEEAGLAAPLSARSPVKYMSPQDMLKVRQGEHGWGIPGYSVPRKSATYRSQCFTFPKARKSPFLQQTPSKAPPTSTINSQKSADRLQRPTFQAQRITFIDTITRFAGQSPGPGSHSPDFPSKPPHGVTFPKESGLSFISNTEFNAEQTPGVGHYSPNPVKSGPLKQSFFFTTRKSRESIEKKRDLGPGSYFKPSYVRDIKKDRLFNDPVRSQSVRPVMNKAKRVTVMEEIIKKAKENVN